MTISSGQTTARVRLRHRAFRTLLGALAAPGTRAESPLDPAGASGDAALALFVEAVYDERTPAWSDASIRLPLPNAVALEEAHVLAVRGELEPGVIEAAKRGHAESPEGGATIFALSVDGAPEERVTLDGPGLDGPRGATLPLSRAAIEARARACAEFPTGIDIVFIDARGTIRALPRTTRIGTGG